MLAHREEIHQDHLLNLPVRALSHPLGGCAKTRRLLEFTSTLSHGSTLQESVSSLPTTSFQGLDTATARWLFFCARLRGEGAQRFVLRTGLAGRVRHVHQPARHREVADERREFDDALLAEMLQRQLVAGVAHTVRDEQFARE